VVCSVGCTGISQIMEWGQVQDRRIIGQREWNVCEGPGQEKVCYVFLKY